MTVLAPPPYPSRSASQAPASSPSTPAAGTGGVLHGRRKHTPLRDSSGVAEAAAGSWHAQDLAFQRAMMRAVGSGLEKPPLIGVFKDTRRFDAPRLFEPVPYSSGCTSPACECAELVAVAGLTTTVATAARPARPGRNESDP
jgi:hypothetical protein